MAAVARFFGGGKLGIVSVKQWLKAAGAAKLFDLKAVKAADLALQRLLFAPRLFVAAGYSGWCVLLDEVELIGRYSPLQRGKSYAELVRWLGLDKSRCTPGVVSVCAITDDFTDAVINDRQDDELIPRKLEAKGFIEQAQLARGGIEALEKGQVRLRPPDEPLLRRSLDKVRDLYRASYEWDPPQADVGQLEATSTMRKCIKSWITGWDIERLYGERQEIKTDDLKINYRETTDMEKPPESGEEGDGDG